MMPAGSVVRALLRLVPYLMLTFFLMPVQALALASGWPLGRKLPGIYHRMCCRILGIDIRITGAMTADRPVLFVGNHLSYLDITVIGAAIDGSFIAKAEVGRWPIYGTLARLQRSVFIERRAGHAARQRDELDRRLAAGDRLILFPEGTSGDGNHVHPFKSALFAVAERRADSKPLTVQPFSLSYTAIDGLPMGREWRPLLAWYGGMAMAPHAWRLFRLGRVTAELHFHQPVTIDAYNSRKAMAEDCQAMVAAGMAAANAGRSCSVGAGQA